MSTRPTLGGYPSFAFDLVPGFRFVHEPLSSADTAIPSLGHEELRTALADRLEHSSGGAFLIGGFRGAGKTTLVSQVLDDLRTVSDERTYAIIRMNVARPVQPSELLYGIMRRLFETLDEQGLLERLPEEVRSALVLSYLRTTVSLASKRADVTETTHTAGLSGSMLPTTLASLAPKLERSTKRSRSAATEIAFLTYGEADVEHDFLRIIRLLADCRLPSRSLWGRWRGQSEPAIHVVVVLDELDKLSASQAGLRCLDDLLGSLKNVLITRGLHVLFVAGTDLLDVAAADSQQGNAIFESMFAWTAYVPAMWHAPRQLLAAVVSTGGYQDGLDELGGYLEYKSRGGPRRLFQELNALVRWKDGAPRLGIDEFDGRRLSFYAKLNGVLSLYLDEPEPEAQTSLTADRFRLGAYYVLDWVLRSEGSVFVAQDVVAGPKALGAHLDISARRVARLLETLVEQSILYHPRDSSSAFSTQIRDSPTSGEPQFRLTEAMREDLVAIAMANPDERAELLSPLSPSGYAAPARYGYQPGSSPASAYGQSAPPYATGPYPMQPQFQPSQSAPEYAWSAPTQYPDSRTVVGLASSAAPSTPEPLEVGDYQVPRDLRFIGGGRYELLDVLGSGGMGTVYVGKETRSGSKVAVKILPARAGADLSLRARFAREAKIAQDLQVPGVVVTHEVTQEPDGRMAIVMDMVEGTGLGAAIGDGMSADQAVATAAQLLVTIGLLHDRGLIRFDVKPENVILDADSKPVMVDFGLARPLLENAVASQITLDGYIVGTPAFMAPEQLSASAIDGRVDIFALGVLLFVMVGGDVTKQDDSPEALIARRRTEDHISTEGLTCSAELRRVIERATARDPGNRFQTASSAREALLLVPEAAA